MNKKVPILFLLCCCLVQVVSAQLVNTGQILSVSKNGLLFVDGNYEHESGTVVNNGTLELKGDWINNDPASYVFSIASTGLVDFSGAKQLIGGTFKTVFPTVSLTGTDYKTLGSDVEIFGYLELNEHELKIENFDLHILNSSQDAISRTSGFISTDKKGRLMRTMDAFGSYLFPLGSSLSQNANPLYRPIIVEPRGAASDPNIFYATFIPEDASSGNYDREKKRQDIQEVFDHYYYILSHESLSEVNVKFYQKSSEEGNYKQLISWNTNFNLWEKAAPSSIKEEAFTDMLNRNVLFTSTQSFKELPFTFSDFSSDDKLLPNPLTIFNAFSPDGDGRNDTWIIKNLDIYPNNTLTIFNRWGDEVFKTTGYDTSKAWDGGSVSSGTYYYILNVEMDGQMKTYKGFITMIKKD